MYWCCGKLNKDAPGCKFDKHQARNEAEDEDEDEADVGNNLIKKAVCICCKETGHDAHKCENDPNYHTTSTDLVEDQQTRLNKIKDKKKLYAHTIV